MFQNKIKLFNRDLKYKIIIKSKTNRIKLTMDRVGNFTLYTPIALPNFLINAYMFYNRYWIIKKLENFKKNSDNNNFFCKKSEAQKIVEKSLENFNKYYNYKYNRISIKNQKTRWGSCSKKGNLNFNYKIIDLSEEQRDYIIVHELCHLKELNHKTNFWKLVSITVPDYKRIRQELKAINIK